MDFATYFPSGFMLETDKVLLRPLEKDDLEKFRLINQPPEIFKYFSKQLDMDEELQLWVEEALHDRTKEKRVPFTVVDKATDAVCGSTSYGNISFYDKRIEIGWTWLGEDYMGSGINRHCKYALLQYAFGLMQFERVEIKTDNLNERAKQALHKIGAVEEGVLRSHMQMPQNRRRDTIYFSILRKEWDEVRRDFFSGVDA